MSQKRTHELGGRKREERVGELGNVAHHKRGLTFWRGGRERSGLVSLETQSVTKQGLTHWKGGRGRRAFVSLKMWHVTKDSPTGGEEEGGAGWEARKRSKSQTTA